MSDLVPDGWKCSNIGKSMLNVPKKYNAIEGGNPRYIGLEHISPMMKRLNHWGYANEVISTKSVFSIGDTLFGKLRPYLEKVSLADFDGICSTDILVIRAKTGICSEFLYVVMSSEKAIRHSVESSAGNIMPRTSWKYMAEYQFLLPPLPEQQKIAAILTSVDEVIEKTQAQIDKLKDFKTGMMQELLTKGVGIDGKPHTEFKDSPVGRIPKEWEVYELGDLASKIEGGGTPSRTEPVFWNGGIPWATVKDLKEVQLSSTQEYISPLGLEKSASKLIPANTMIIASRMAVGKAVMFNKDVSINQDLKAFYPTNNLDSKFLLHWYLSKAKYIEGLGTGSTVKGIRLEDLKLLVILLPPIEEQHKIASLLTSIDEVIQAKTRKKEVQKNTKKALMQDLLTGKVRVTVPTPSSAKAS